MDARERAYVPAIHVLLPAIKKDVDARAGNLRSLRKLGCERGCGLVALEHRDGGGFLCSAPNSVSNQVFGAL
jgi:hypothetical protein